MHQHEPLDSARWADSEGIYATYSLATSNYSELIPGTKTSVETQICHHDASRTKDPFGKCLGTRAWPQPWPHCHTSISNNLVVVELFLPRRAAFGTHTSLPTGFEDPPKQNEGSRSKQEALKIQAGCEAKPTAKTSKRPAIPRQVRADPSLCDRAGDVALPSCRREAGACGSESRRHVAFYIVGVDDQCVVQSLVWSSAG